MSSIVCCIIFGFFIILGIVDVIKFFIFNMFKLSEYTYEKILDRKLTVPEEINSENMEYIIRSALIQNAWSGNPVITEIICPEINNEESTMLNILSKNCSYLEIKNNELITDSTSTKI